MKHHEDPDYWLTIYSPHLERLREHRLEMLAMGFTALGEILPFEPWKVPATGKFFFKARIMKGSMSREESRVLAEWDRLWSGDTYDEVVEMKQPEVLDEILELLDRDGGIYYTRFCLQQQIGRSRSAVRVALEKLVDLGKLRTIKVKTSPGCGRAELGYRRTKTK